MPEEELHYPPGAEPEPKTPAVEEPKAPEAEAPKPEDPKPQDPKAPEAEKPKDEPKDPPADPPINKKPRSIYDDLKDKKHEVKETRTQLEQAQSRITELEGLLAAKDDAKTPAEKSEAAKDIAEYATKHNLDPNAIEELTAVILAKVPKVEIPEGMTPDELADWRAGRATAKQQAEDQAVLAEAPSVKTQLTIHDDKELDTVMKEVVRLSHTPEFHDKEVEYIVWKNKDALSKLVSPKKPSFEKGGSSIDPAPEAEPDYTSGAKVTPEMLSKQPATRKSSYEVRRAQ